MSGKNNVLLVIFILTSWKLNTGAAIVCYDCNSKFDPRCGEQFDPFTLGTVNCSLRDPPEGFEDVEPTICRSIKIQALGKTRVVRSCGYQRHARDDKPCYRTSGTHDLFTTYCSCSTDLCNHSSSLKPRVLLAAATVGVLMKLG